MLARPDQEQFHRETKCPTKCGGAERKAARAYGPRTARRSRNQRGGASHLFGDRLPDFEADLRRLLRDASPGGRFSERRCEIAMVIWCPWPPCAGGAHWAGIWVDQRRSRTVPSLPTTVVLLGAIWAAYLLTAWLAGAAPRWRPVRAA